MLPADIANETVVRLRGSVSTDIYNDQSVDWSNPAPLSIAGCSVQSDLGSEDNVGRNAVTSGARFFGPPECDVKATDRIVDTSGMTWEVDGPVPLIRDTTGNGWDHKTCRLEWVEG